jgi:hypothetical protein
VKGIVSRRREVALRTNQDLKPEKWKYTHWVQIHVFKRVPECWLSTSAPWASVSSCWEYGQRCALSGTQFGQGCRPCSWGAKDQSHTHTWCLPLPDTSLPNSHTLRARCLRASPALGMEGTMTQALSGILETLKHISTSCSPAHSEGYTGHC